MCVCVCVIVVKCLGPCACILLPGDEVGVGGGPLGTMYSYFWLLICCSERMLIFTLLSMESGQYVLIKYVIFAQREFIHDISIG